MCIIYVLHSFLPLFVLEKVLGMSDQWYFTTENNFYFSYNSALDIIFQFQFSNNFTSNFNSQLHNNFISISVLKQL